MPNPQTPNNTYAAMREALEQKHCCSCSMGIEAIDGKQAWVVTQKCKRCEALALPEPSQPDPAQELLASVQLERLKTVLDGICFTGVPNDYPVTTTQVFLQSLVNFPTPNKADAEALVRVLRAAKRFNEALKIFIDKDGYFSPAGTAGNATDPQKAEYFLSLMEVGNAYEAATPLIKQIAGGG